MPRSATDICSACGSPGTEEFFSVSEVPVHVCVLWTTPEAARSCPRGEITLSFCRECGFIGNKTFEPDLLNYVETYENSLGFSEFFQGYIRGYAARVIERHSLHDKAIIEIGCGDGEFLSLLCELGGNRGVGFDPSFSPDKAAQLHPSATIIPDYYTDEHKDQVANLIVCRQVLEHVTDPIGFLTELRTRLLGRPGIAFEFEVPNALYTLEQTSLWDVIYEHCTYFTPDSLASTFRLAGFRVLHLEDTYEGQFLSIGAHLSPSPDQAGTGNGAQRTAEKVDDFKTGYREKLDSWRATLTRSASSGRRVALWGAGARGVNFLNLLGVGSEIGYVVDANPRKHGSYLPGTAHQVRHPRELAEFKPELVIIMNPIYHAEISQSLEELGVKADVQIA
jgi:hypothetical protein